jgi:ribosome biogenesis protein UTP30
LSQKPSQILENLKTALPAIVQHIKDGWDNVQSLLIKTNSSVSLPIWTCNLDDSNEGRWDGLTVKVEGEQGGSKDEEEVESGVESSPEVKRQTNDAKAKGKKRVSEDHKNEEDEPSKKRKRNANDASKQKVKDSPLEPAPPKNKASTPQTKKTSKSNRTVKQEQKKIDPGSESDASGMALIPLTRSLSNRIAQMR